MVVAQAVLAPQPRVAQAGRLEGRLLGPELERRLDGVARAVAQLREVRRGGERRHGREQRGGGRRGLGAGGGRARAHAALAAQHLDEREAPLRHVARRALLQQRVAEDLEPERRALAHGQRPVQRDAQQQQVARHGLRAALADREVQRPLRRVALALRDGLEHVAHVARLYEQQA